MTPQQYQKVKDRLGLSHPNLAALIGVSRRQSQRYALGEDPIPQSTAIVLTLLLDGRSRPRILKLIEIEQE
jgi:plasmid maintenance system antidote protein VapI